VVTLVVYAGLGAATFFVALFLQQIAGYSALQAGLALLPVTLLLVSLSRRFGALAARAGPRLVMTGGPLVGGAGLLAFTRAGAHPDYLTDVLPAVLLFGTGLAMTVAPLTATVLEAADRRYAGIASGVNNAFARVAALVAIAAVGAVISAQFAAALDATPAGRPADAAGRAYVADAREHPLAPPGAAAPGPVRAVVREAGVEGFHAGMLVAGLLMISGGLVAAAGIRNPRRRTDARPVLAGTS
jgi:predicted MFS family arabinose efflux permease